MIMLSYSPPACITMSIRGSDCARTWSDLTYVSVGVHVVVGELDLVEGDVVHHPVAPCGWTIWVEVESARDE